MKNNKEKAWYDDFFVENILKKKYKERAIIDDLYSLYKLYPDYYRVSYQYEELENAKIVRTIQIAKESLKSVVTTGTAVALTGLMGVSFSPDYLLAATGIAAGGALAFYNNNRDGMVKVNLNKKQQDELFVNLTYKCDQFFALLASYLDKVQDYVLLYDKNDNSIEWNKYLYNIFEDNDDYIESKKEEGCFELGFNINTASKFHDQIFDRDELNDALVETKQLYGNEGVTSKIKTKKK